MIAFVVAGCSNIAAAPGAVQRTLRGVESMGFACGEGKPDNVPSGTSQWHCVDGTGGLTILVSGNGDGATEITLVTSSTDPAAARDRFGDVVKHVPPLDIAPALVGTLATWTGRQQSSEVGGVRVTAQCDEFQCIVDVTSAESPIRPLPLP